MTVLVRRYNVSNRLHCFYHLQFKENKITAPNCEEKNVKSGKCLVSYLHQIDHNMEDPHRNIQLYESLLVTLRKEEAQRQFFTGFVKVFV